MQNFKFLVPERGFGSVLLVGYSGLGFLLETLSSFNDCNGLFIMTVMLHLYGSVALISFTARKSNMLRFIYC